MNRICVIVVILLLSNCTRVTRAADMFVYFGTHSEGPGKGFSLSHFDTETGVLTKPQFLIEAVQPAFFIIHPDGKHLYTCNSGSPGGISAYEIDPKTAQLKLLNKIPAAGGDPSFVSIDKTGRFLLDANYQGGNIEVYAIQPDGSLGERTALVQHTGSSINPQRQMHPFAHCIVTEPMNRFALVPDLGVDKLFIYKFDEKTGELETNDPPAAAIKPGSGPRHVRFHPDGKHVYLVSEIASTITAFDWDSQKGALKEFQTISTLPEGFTGTSTSAEMEIHPNGRFIYGTNRGHDSIAVFAIDPASGKLALVQHISSGGKTPRNFAFDPTGQWLLCTNHGSNNAVVFKVDAASGKLTQQGEPVEVPSPFCERFLPVK